jgi:hypothetical protein
MLATARRAEGKKKLFRLSSVLQPIDERSLTGSMDHVLMKRNKLTIDLDQLATADPHLGA